MRQSAEQRREAVLDAALAEFAERGLHGASTDNIARRAGISQPYLFRLFGTKKELFLATVERTMGEIRAAFAAAAEGRTGEDALRAMGDAYFELLRDRTRLLCQMQAFAACEDDDVRAVVRRGFGEIVELVERASGGSEADVARFVAVGMLLNVVAAMGVADGSEPWARRVLAGIREG